MELSIVTIKQEATLLPMNPAYTSKHYLKEKVKKKKVMKISFLLLSSSNRKEVLIFQAQIPISVENLWQN